MRLHRPRAGRNAQRRGIHHPHRYETDHAHEPVVGTAVRVATIPQRREDRMNGMRQHASLRILAYTNAPLTECSETGKRQRGYVYPSASAAENTASIGPPRWSRHRKRGDQMAGPRQGRWRPRMVRLFWKAAAISDSVRRKESGVHAALKRLRRLRQRVLQLRLCRPASYSPDRHAPP